MNEDPGVRIVRATADHADAVLDFVLRNHDYLAPFEPLRPPSHATIEATRARLSARHRIEYLAIEGGRMLGQVAISNVSRAPVYLNCTIGYSVDEYAQGRGIATALVEHAVHEAFTVHALHRVEAGTLLHNVASMRVLEKVGFTRIGVSPRHVKIAGRWQDHMLFAITVEAFDG